MPKPPTPEPTAKEQPPKAGIQRVMSPQMSIYYSNSVMVATSPKDVSLYFGRYVPTTTDDGNQTLAEFYERQIYMTYQQAEELMRALAQTMEALRSRQSEQKAR